METLYNRLGSDRIESRQIDELIGLARGLIADGKLNEPEVEYLHSWLATNLDISGHPVVGILYKRVSEILKDGVATEDECQDLFDTLRRFASADTALGEDLKSTDLPLCDPAPRLVFAGQRYTFTGTFVFGQRKHCEEAVLALGASAGGLSKTTNVLVIGSYVTSSWKHSSFGNKIVKAVEWRESGMPIAIVSEDHWKQYV